MGRQVVRHDRLVDPRVDEVVDAGGDPEGGEQALGGGHRRRTLSGSVVRAVGKPARRPPPARRPLALPLVDDRDRQDRPRPLRRGPLGGLDDRPRAGRRDAAGASRPTPRWPAPPSCCAAATSRSPRPPPAARRAARRRLGARHRPSLRREVGGDHGPRRAALQRRGARSRSRRSSPRGGGLVVLGETEQDKYGNNLNELLARFGVEIENATVQDYEHHRGDAPSWVLADLLPGHARRLRPARPGRRGLLLPGRHAGARQRGRADRRDAARPRRRPSSRSRRSPSTATAASSCSPTPTCSATTASRRSTTRRSGLNLVYWAAGPSFAAAPERAGIGRRRGSGLGAARRARRRAAPHRRRPTARSTSTSTSPHGSPRPSPT